MFDAAFNAPQGWFPLGVDCRRSVKNSLLIISALAPGIKLNRETKNFSRYACNLRLMETSHQSSLFAVASGKGETSVAEKVLDHTNHVLVWQES